MDVMPFSCKVFICTDSLDVIMGLIGPADICTLLQAGIGDDAKLVVHGTDKAGLYSEYLFDLCFLRGSVMADDVRELLFMEFLVSSDQRQYRPVICNNCSRATALCCAGSARMRPAAARSR